MLMLLSLPPGTTTTVGTGPVTMSMATGVVSVSSGKEIVFDFAHPFTSLHVTTWHYI